MVLPPQLPQCRCTIVVPARNEADHIASTLEALCRQRNLDASQLDAHSYEVIVFANGCSDATAEVARSVAARDRRTIVHVVEADELEIPHVGIARRTAMDIAAARFLETGKTFGIIASTDADTLVASDWIAHILQEMKTVDAVAGNVFVDSDELTKLPPSFRKLYDRERAYRRELARLESSIDPVACDPWPRHASFVGAAFAVSARAYAGAGGLPPIPLLEDREFSFALRRSGARIRHSLAVRATTSARRFARVDGGFGAFVADLVTRGNRGESFVVENPGLTFRKMQIGAITRALRSTTTPRHTIEELTNVMSAPREYWLPHVSAIASPGALWHALVACETLVPCEPVPVESAIATIRALIDAPATAYEFEPRAATEDAA